MTSVVLTPASTGCVESTEEDSYRSMYREAIQEGLSELRWGWKQSIAKALRIDFGADSDSLITLGLVNSIILEAEAKGLWAPGWAEVQLAEARAVQRLTTPRSPFVARGSQIGNSALTEQEVRDIRRLFARQKKRLEQQRKRVTIKLVAKQYGVHPITIRRVLGNESWKHV